MKLVSILFIHFLFITTLPAQPLYYGQVSDVGSRQPVENVQIIILNTSDSTFTNQSGDYIISPAQDEDHLTNLNGEIYVNHTSIYWYLNAGIQIQIITMDGKILLKTGFLPETGTYHLPVDSPGNYILYISSPKGSVKTYIFSTGDEIALGYRSSTFNNRLPSLARDSLIFSKPGYYVRKVSAPRHDTLININLLKKQYDDIDYMNELISYEAFDMLESHPLTSNLSEVQSVKIIYDSDDDIMYYVNSKKYGGHYSFAEQVLGYDKGYSSFVYKQYTDNKGRYLFPAAINYFKSSDIYVLEFFPADGARCDQIEKVLDKIKSTSYLDKKIKFHYNNQKWATCNAIPLISSDELYAGQNYQALNLEENYGYLRKVDIDNLNTTYLGRHDIVLLNGIPNDIPVVAGIITTEFQTPLSHINVLSHNRGTPNMALHDGWTDHLLDSLTNSLVYLKVESDSFTIRKASPDEALSFWNLTEPQNTVFLEKNISYTGLADLNEADKSWTGIIGGKAANFAELLNVKNTQGIDIPVPEGYFAIPFSYYQQHFNALGLDTYVQNMLNDSMFYENTAYRQNVLAKLRDSISNAPLNSELLEIVLQKLNEYNEFTRFRFRSSTNAEDLEFFSGAGLYSSFTGNLNSGADDIEQAIKDVWASLWNFRAFEEREYYKIDHSSTAMGILVHRSFPDEDANGVLITRNLYNANSALTINVQYKEYSIVYPEPGIIHDQIILYTFSIQGQYPYTIDYLLHSNVPELRGEHVLTDDELYGLGDLCQAIKKHFYNYVPHSCDCDYKDFALDIEFKIDSMTEPRKIYTKQVRPYQ